LLSIIIIITIIAIISSSSLVLLAVQIHPDQMGLGGGEVVPPISQNSNSNE
jgi:hypothetical protein